MRAIFYTASLFIMAIGSKASARSPVDPVYQSFGKFTEAVKQYHEKTNGAYPTSWRDFHEKVGVGHSSAIKDARWYLDIENRYVFLDPPVETNNGYGDKIILMATDTELEGITGRGDMIIPGRYMIVDRKDTGIMQTLIYEKSLARIFEKQGLDLADYTKATTFVTPLEPRNAKSKREQAKRANNRTPRRVENHTGNSAAPPSGSSDAVASNDKPSSSSSLPWWAYGLSGLFVVAGAAALIKMKNKPSSNVTNDTRLDF